MKEPIKVEQDFFLFDYNGNIINLKNILKSYNLIFFGYTSCPDVCFLALKDISETLRYVKKKEINVIFISLDLKRDKPEIVKSYLSKFNSSFLGFIPKDENELYKISKFFSVAYEIDTLSGYIGHSAFIIFVKGNKIIEYFPIGMKPIDIASDINKF
ncbi:MAG: SCO family protein [candidate division WOR-3 bacterium]